MHDRYSLNTVLESIYSFQSLYACIKLLVEQTKILFHKFSQYEFRFANQDFSCILILYWGDCSEDCLELILEKSITLTDCNVV